jgi:hypothetical protein
MFMEGREVIRKEFELLGWCWVVQKMRKFF